MPKLKIAPQDNAVLISKKSSHVGNKLEPIGSLKEKRTKDGELILMDLDPVPSQWGELREDNILYFRKIEHGLYCWIDFETYASSFDDNNEPDWLRHACTEIDLDSDTSPPGRERGKLQRVLEDAERTIQLVRQGKPIQTHTDRGTTTWSIKNEVRPRKVARGLRSAFAELNDASPASCDVFVDTHRLRQAILTIQSKSRARANNINIAPSRGGIRIQLRNAPLKQAPLEGRGKWTKQIAVSGSRVLSSLEKTSESNVRLTYMAGRLFLDQANIPAEESEPT